MAEVQITVEVPDEIMERVRAFYARDDQDDPAQAEVAAALCEDAEVAVLDSVRASFYPSDLLEDPLADQWGP